VQSGVSLANTPQISDFLNKSQSGCFAGFSKIEKKSKRSPKRAFSTRGRVVPPTGHLEYVVRRYCRIHTWIHDSGIRSINDPASLQ
jgi:hypothetical protein